MKIIWEEGDVYVGARYEVQVEGGSWMMGIIAVQDWALQIDGVRTGVGAKNSNDQQYVIIVGNMFIGPFETKQALVKWLNDTQRARIR